MEEYNKAKKLAAKSTPQATFKKAKDKTGEDKIEMVNWKNYLLLVLFVVNKMFTKL